MKNGERKKESFLKDTLMSEAIECGFESLAGTSACGTLFMNRFSEEDLRALLDEIGLAEHLKKKGFGAIAFTIERDDSGMHHLGIFSGRPSAHNLLIGLRASETVFSFEKALIIGGTRSMTANVIVMEWIQAQDPRKRFAESDVPLPSQDHPGIGAVPYMLEFLRHVCVRAHRDAVAATPAHLHGAIMYHRRFSFADPDMEGMLRAIIRDCGGYSLADMSWAMVTGCMYEADTGMAFEFEPSTQLYPIGKALNDYFASRGYVRRVRRAMARRRFLLDYDTMVKKRNELLRRRASEKKPDGPR